MHFCYRKLCLYGVYQDMASLAELYECLSYTKRECELPVLDTESFFDASHGCKVGRSCAFEKEIKCSLNWS